MRLTGLRKQRRRIGKIKGYSISSRTSEPKLWLAILLFALPTLTNTTKIKQKNDVQDNKVDLKAHDTSKDTHLLTNYSNSIIFDNFNNPTKNESYFSAEHHSPTNKENESNVKNTYMDVSGAISITKDNETYEFGNKDDSNITNVKIIGDVEAAMIGRVHEKTQKDDISKILNTTKLNFERNNTAVTNNTGRHFRRIISVDGRLEPLENTNVDSGITPNEKDLRKINKVTEYKNNNEKRDEIKVEQRDITNAIDFGIKALEDLVKIKEPQLYKLGLFLDKDHPAARVASFGAPVNRKAILMSRVGYATLEASKKIAQAYPKNVGRQSAGIPNELQSRIDLEACPLRGRPRCPPASRRFRTSDGTCNNLEHPWRGAAMLPMQRFLPPVYQDGIQSVRLSIFDEPLPSARVISTVIHRDKNREIQSVTMMFTQWGQFIDHDITSTVKARSFNGSIPRCCDAGGRGMLPPDLLHPSCLPIEVPRTDPFLSSFGIECMEFIRSAPSTRIDCELGWQEQINQVTPYMDASTIYGSDVDTSDSIRMFRNGQIIYGRPQNQGPLNPPDPPDAELCRAGAVSEDCLQPGDTRVSENPGLIALHTIFVRYHNKVADVLSKNNPHWSDERVYQETRRIVYSVIQHITYREYLPVLLGPEVMDIFELRVLRKGFYDKYDKRIVPAVANSFSTAAFRFGHSMIQNSYLRTDSQHIPLPNNVSLHEEISNFNNIWTFGSVDRILLGFSNQPSQRRDEFIADELTNHLFQFSDATSFGMDLAAINIQRGRDHGIPPYTSWREPCGLSPVTLWRDLEKIMGVNKVIRLRTLYLHVKDIDLFTGGLAEKPLRGGVVGPTFACIIAQQFSNLRKGDRFWYENDGFESSFSPAQLQQIRKVSLAQIICQTTDEVETIQHFVFLSADKMRNVRVSCDSPEIANFDLGAWAERSFEFNGISDNLDPFEQERSQNDNLNLIRRRRVFNTPNLKTENPKNTTGIKSVNVRPKRVRNFSQIHKQLTSNSSDHLTRHRRDSRSKKRKTTATPPTNNTLKSKTKATNTARKASKNEVTTLKPIRITSLPFEVKLNKFNNIPTKRTFATHATTRPTKKKPQYYQIQDQSHNDVTYLFGILPKHTTKAPTPMNQVQVNININYSPHPTIATATMSSAKKKKRPTNSNSPTNDYVFKPTLTATHKPTDLYGQDSVVIITKRPPAPTKRPVTSQSTSISYPVFIYNPAYEKPISYEVTASNPTYIFDNDRNPDVPSRPINNKRPDPEYYPNSYGDDDRYIPITTNNKFSTTYQNDDNSYNHAYITQFDKKPLYISTSDRPALFETRPFSSSNRRHSTNSSSLNVDRYGNKKPTNSYYFDNDSELVTINRNKKRPQSTLDDKDESYFNDDILNGFFNEQYDKLENTHKKPNTKLNDNTKTKVNIDGKLDFKSRTVYKKGDKNSANKDDFVEISSITKQEYFGKEKEKTSELNGKIRKKRRSGDKTRLVNIDVMPSESRNEWKYFNAIEEATVYMEVPEIPVNMPCSYEVPKPINFVPSNAGDV